jgi:hypothetical protein
MNLHFGAPAHVLYQLVLVFFVRHVVVDDRVTGHLAVAASRIRIMSCLIKFRENLVGIVACAT